MPAYDVRDNLPSACQDRLKNEKLNSPRFLLTTNTQSDTITEVLIQGNLQRTKGDFECTKLLFLA